MGCIGGILVIDGEVIEFSSLEINEISALLRGAKSPRRLISFFAPLGACRDQIMDTKSSL